MLRPLSIVSVFVFAIGLGAVAACDNPNYCPGLNANDNCNEGEPPRCTSNDNCTSENARVCDTGTGMCVQCTTADNQCPSATPACVDNACAACTEHAQCGASNLCLPSGECANTDDVAYISSPDGVDNPNCTLTSPCKLVFWGLATGRPYIKLHGTLDENGTIEIDSRIVTFFGDPGAKLIRTSVGIVMEVRGASEVGLNDVEISGGNGGSGIGISLPAGNTASLSLTRVHLSNNQAGGIRASDGALTVTQSTISNNQGGGISVTNGTFVIVGNVFYKNGRDNLAVGGISISTAENAANRLEFNSFNKNLSLAGRGAALDCVAGNFTARNNIMSDNGSFMNEVQVTGACVHEYSIVRPGTLPSGEGNSNMDPLFQNTENGDLHIRPGSPALGAADPDSNLTGPAEFDLDGDRRSSRADIGADEVP